MEPVCPASCNNTPRSAPRRGRERLRRNEVLKYEQGQSLSCLEPYASEGGNIIGRDPRRIGNAGLEAAGFGECRRWKSSGRSASTAAPAPPRRSDTGCHRLLLLAITAWDECVPTSPAGAEQGTKCNVSREYGKGSGGEAPCAHNGPCRSPMPANCGLGRRVLGSGERATRSEETARECLLPDFPVTCHSRFTCLMTSRKSLRKSARRRAGKPGDRVCCRLGSQHG
jgi:hypothetical protein